MGTFSGLTKPNPKLIWVLSILTLSFLILRQGPARQPPDPNKDRNIAFDYDGTMRFGVKIIKDAKGKPINKLLTYSSTGGTNNTLVRVDGKDVPYGDVSGKLLQKGSKDDSPSRSVWALGDIEIAQVLEIRPGVDGALDTLLVRYVIENKGGAPHKVGLRTMLDSLIGSNDGVPFTVAGSKELVTTFRDFPTPDTVPAWVEALENADVKNPGVIAHMALKVGGGMEAPGRVSITRWRSGPPWEVPIGNMGGDSCLVLYWQEANLAPGQKRELGYAYGTQSAPTPPPPPSKCPQTFARTWWNSNPWGKLTVQVVGDKATGTYDNRNGNAGTMTGTVTGNVLTADWKDARGQGTLIVTLAADGCGWNGTYQQTVGPDGQAGPRQPANGVDANQPGAKLPGNPWATPQGQACMDKWMAEVVRRLNTTDLGPDWNPRKPFSFNKYGIVEDRNLKSNAAPDNFPQYQNNKYWWMWENPDYQVNVDNHYPFAHWNKAGVPPMRDFVLKCVGPTDGPEPPVDPTGMILQAPHLIVPKGALVIVPVKLLRAKNVTNLDFLCNYDPAVATARPAAEKGILVTEIWEYKLAEAGLFKFNFAQLAPAKGSGTVAGFRFDATGPARGKTPLTLTVHSVGNAKGDKLPIRVIHGSITIYDPDDKSDPNNPANPNNNGGQGGQGMQPTCSGMGRQTVADAQCCLKMWVGLSPTGMHMDVNRDGVVDSRDAVRVLQNVARELER